MSDLGQFFKFISSTIGCSFSLIYYSFVSLSLLLLFSATVFLMLIVSIFWSRRSIEKVSDGEEPESNEFKLQIDYNRVGGLYAAAI